MEAFQNFMFNIFNNIKKQSINIYDFIKKHKYVSISSFFLMIYIILFYVITFKYSFKVFEEYNMITNIIFLTIGLIWGFSILFKYNNIDREIKTAFFVNAKNVLLITIGLAMFFSIIYILSSSYAVNNVISILINIFLIIGAIYIVYRLIKNSSFIKRLRENKIFHLIYDIIFSVPNVIFNSFERLFVDIKDSPRSLLLFLLFELILIFLYFMYPIIIKKIYTHNAKILLNKPIYTDSKNTIGNYEKLYKNNNNLKKIGKEELNYNYGLSCWLFIDNVGENYNEKTNIFTSLINYGNKPNIQYNASTHTLIIKMKIGIDEEKIIYETKDIQLQKWNNFVINNNGGITDVFINSKLVASVNNVVPYMKLDNIETGEEEGVPGAICNVLYYPEPISKIKIDWLYKYFKNKTPPII